jgi:hypothetical protein
MSWEDIQVTVLRSCEDILRAHGYKLVKSRNHLEKTIATGRLIVRFTFVASDVGNRFVRVGCGVRNHAIEEIVNRTSSLEQRSQAFTTTIDMNCDTIWWLNTEKEQAATITGMHKYFREVALPFLEKEYSLEDFSALLNVTNPEGRPVYRVGMGTRFWQRGLAAAKLAGDARFDELKRHYTEHVRELSNGLYFPEFERCVRIVDACTPRR